MAPCSTFQQLPSFPQGGALSQNALHDSRARFCSLHYQRGPRRPSDLIGALSIPFLCFVLLLSTLPHLIDGSFVRLV